MLGSNMRRILVTSALPYADDAAAPLRTGHRMRRGIARRG